MSESFSNDTRDIIFIKNMINHHKNTVAKSKRISKTSKNSKLQLVANNLAGMLETQISILQIMLNEYDSKIKCVKGSNNEYICAQKPKKMSGSKSSRSSKKQLNSRPNKKSMSKSSKRIYNGIPIKKRV